MNINRRNFLKGTAAGAAGTALAGGVLIGGAHADADAATTSGPATEASYPFHGAHQSGVLTPGPSGKQAFTCVASFDATASSKAELADLLRTLTARARFLTTGGTPADLGVSQPPSDSDVLGPVIPADGLTATLSVGSTLFDDRYGLAAAKPRKLTPMTAFPNDALEPAWLGGDLLLQFCANHPDTIHHAIRDITKHTRGGMQLAWKMEGYNSPPRPSGTSRNLLGFKDGTANPTGATATDLVWVDDPAEPAWTAGRLLRGGAADPDAGRVLGPRVDQRAGGDVRPAAGQRRAARRQQRVRHARLQGRPAGERHPARLAHQAGQPAHPRDRQPAAHPPLLQLRPRR